jgi:hypothetical protein
MSTQIILKVLALRHRLRQRDRWTRPQLEAHQDRALHRLRRHAYARSPFYRRFHKGVTDCPLGDLPILTKEMVMEHFDELVTDPTVRLADVEAHLATLSGGDELLTGATGWPPPRGARVGGAYFFGTRTSGPPCLPPTTAPSTGRAWGPVLPTARGWRW